MVSFPFCKINLGLQIVSKRDDGYHNLVTCFYPIPWTDVLEIIPSREFSFQSSGLEIAGDSNSNLCVKACKLLAKDFDLSPVQIYLHKIIPMGAGLGGGSSDGAFTLRTLNKIFKLQLSTTDLAGYASMLGSDCAYFLQDDPMFGEGRGDVLSPVKVSLKGKSIVLVKPPVHVSTAEAYAGVTPATPTYNLREILERSPVSSWKGIVTNDFEKSVFGKFPELQKIKENLYRHGAVYAAMSGSGSTVFGIFDAPVAIQDFPPDFTVFSAIL